MRISDWSSDLCSSDLKELGDVAQVLRDADDKVDRLLVEIDGIGPDRYVHVPVQGLKPVVRGTDTDLEARMTKAALMALPEVQLPAPCTAVDAQRQMGDSTHPRQRRQSTDALRHGPKPNGHALRSDRLHGPLSIHQLDRATAQHDEA